MGNTKTVTPRNIVVADNIVWNAFVLTGLYWILIMAQSHTNPIQY